MLETPALTPATACTTQAGTPLRVSVIVRSYNRLDACTELLELLLKQDWEDYEVIVVEQSTLKSPEQEQRLQALAERAPRLRILQRPPLGPPGARNEGCRHATGEVLLFIDDDDQPVSRQWIRQHAENFSDTTVVGVSGGDILSPEESLTRCPYRSLPRARRRNISYSLLGVPYCYPRLRERVEPVGWLRGGNSAVRRALVEAVGGWDEGVVDHEEHSFAFRMRRHLPPGHRLVFDPRPVILRRNDLGGGLERRFAGAATTYRRWFDYFHRIYASYHRLRFVALYPAYPALLAYLTAKWVWESSRSHPTVPRKLVAIAWVMLMSPLWFALGWMALLRAASGRKRGTEDSRSQGQLRP
jgi:glycosyltransferase involved in cell wall biosynthesis